MRTFLTVPILAAALLVASGAALAAGHGNNAAGHGLAAINSNGIRSLDRDRGLERAAERRNSRSLTDRRVKKVRSKK